MRTCTRQIERKNERDVAEVVIERDVELGPSDLDSSFPPFPPLKPTVACVTLSQTVFGVFVPPNRLAA